MDFGSQNQSRAMSRNAQKSISDKNLSANPSYKSFEMMRPSSNNTSQANLSVPAQGSRPIDGLLQLASYSKLCDELKEENNGLKQQITQQSVNLTNALNEQRDEFVT